MEITLEAIISLIGLFLGGGGGAFFMWRWQRKKAKAEAETAEVDTVKSMQEAYDKMFEQVNRYLEDATGKVEGLRAERDHYKQDRDDIREKMDKMTRSFMDWRLEADNDRSKMKMEIARLGRKVEMMAPFMCGDLSCKLRKRVVLSDEGEPKKPRKKADVEPLNSNEL